MLIEGIFWAGFNLDSKLSHEFVDWERLGLNEKDPADLRLLKDFISKKKVTHLITLLV